MNDEHKYDDIIDLPHHVSTKHPQMSLLDRAAQFSPFAALTGHDAAIRETQRLTEEWVEPDEDKKELLDEKLQMIRESLTGGKDVYGLPEILFTYFQPDEKKSGGAYLSIQGKVRKIDEYGHQVILEDGTSLTIEHIVDIEGELFRGHEDLEYNTFHKGRPPFSRVSDSIAASRTNVCSYIDK